MIKERFTFQDNIVGGFTEVVFDATPGTEAEIVHNLGYIPTGYIVVYQDIPGSIYMGATAWTTNLMYLKCDAASLTARLFVL